MGDRRLKPRFDVVGELWGTIETVRRFRVENIGRGGFLFHSPVRMPIDSVHQLRLTQGALAFSTQVAVRHVREIDGPDGRPSFEVGVAFLAAHPELEAHADVWAEIAGSDTEPADV